MAMASLFVASLVFVRQHALGRLLLAGAVVTTLVFTHLILHHWHYFLMFSPALALLCAQTAVVWERKVACERGWKTCVAFGLVALTLGLSIGQGLEAMKISIFNDPFRTEVIRVLKEKTRDTDKLVIAGGSWGGEDLFRSGRQGLNVWDAKLLEDPASYRRLKDLGFTKLVLISESPLQYAIQAVNFGEGGVPRESYTKWLKQTPAIETWPTVYQTDDILIKELP
jgi:hypothetical protein